MLDRLVQWDAANMEGPPPSLRALSLRKKTWLGPVVVVDCKGII